MKMDQHIEAGVNNAEEIFSEMERFEGFYLSIPDADETLLDKKINYFSYADEDVQFMWVCFRAGARV